MGACCLCACVFKIVLGILNFFILIVGLLVAGIGGILLGLAGSEGFHNFVKIIVLPIVDNIGLYSPSSGLSPVSDDLTEYLKPAGVALIVGGLVIVAVAVIGYCGTSSDIKIFLIVYTIILCVVLVIEIIVVAMFFSKAFDPYIQKGLQTTIHDFYVDMDSGGIYSLSWNVVMIKFNCCGLMGIDDFRSDMKSGNWPKNQSLYINGQSQTVLTQTPVACCVTTGEFPVVKVVDDYCAVNPRNTTNNMNTGCWGAVTEALEPNRAGALTVIVIAILVQAALVGMAWIICCDKKKSNKVDPV